MIYTVGFNGERDKDSTFNFAFESTDAAVSGVGAGTVQVRAYDAIRDAVAGGDTDLLNKSVTLLNVTRALTIKPLKQMQTATVASNFTQFATAPTGGTVAIAGISVGVLCTRGAGDGALLQNANGNDCNGRLFLRVWRESTLRLPVRW